MMSSYFYLVCCTFSISYLALPFHLVYSFQFLHLFFVVIAAVLSQAFASIVEKLLYTYMQYCNKYIFRKFMNLCLATFKFFNRISNNIHCLYHPLLIGILHLSQKSHFISRFPKLQPNSPLKHFGSGGFHLLFGWHHTVLLPFMVKPGLLKHHRIV